VKHRGEVGGRGNKKRSGWGKAIANKGVKKAEKKRLSTGHDRLRGWEGEGKQKAGCDGIKTTNNKHVFCGTRKYGKPTGRGVLQKTGRTKRKARYNIINLRGKKNNTRVKDNSIRKMVCGEGGTG